MKLLITGGGGFLGARLARTLLARNTLAGEKITSVVLTDIAPPPADLLADARVSARTLEYDSFPSANAPEIAGSPRNACAVRTCSRAADTDNPQRHASHSAQLRQLHFTQPNRSSNSRTSTRNR